jgi:hypothetical protein
MRVGARSAEPVTLEEGEVVVSDLVKIPAGEAPTATHTRSSPRPGDVGRVDVLASGTAVLEVHALAELAPKADDDLVEARRVVLGGDEPDAVLEPYFFGVLLVEGESAEFAGGFWRWVRYSGLRHGGLPPCGRASGS